MGKRKTCDWQPIDTAPKRGSILASCPIRDLGLERMKQTLVIAWWRSDINRWRSGFGDLVQPTHWMPLTRSA